MKSIGKHIWAFAVSIASKLYDSTGSSGSPDSSVNVDLSSSTTGYAKTLTTDGNNIYWTDATFVHTQSSASTSWVVTHNLNRHPSVTLLLSASEDIVIGDVTYDSSNQLTVTLSGANTGKAYLN